MRYAIANWKMNVPPEGVGAWCSGVSGADGVWIGAAPPYPMIAEVSASGIPSGAQNCSTEENGAFTGEVSAGMIRSLGAAFIIIGHSERRALYGETDTTVSRKLHRCRAAALLPVLCVGESLEDRESGRTEEVLLRQLSAVAEAVTGWERILLAYEPVWAIGTGRHASPAMVEETGGIIRTILSDEWGADLAVRTALLYGGSVTAENAADLAAVDIDGFLVGGASLSSSKFSAIARALQTG